MNSTLISSLRLLAAGLALAELPGLPGRGERTLVARNGGQVLVIDESYNANPLSMVATLRQLGRDKAERRIAVLGAMRELGNRSEELHRDLAAPIMAAPVDFAILVGPEMAPLASALEGKVAFAHVANAGEAQDKLESIVRGGDAVLVKGSNSVGLSRVVAALTGKES